MYVMPINIPVLLLHQYHSAYIQFVLYSAPHYASFWWSGILFSHVVYFSRVSCWCCRIYQLKIGVTLKLVCWLLKHIVWNLHSLMLQITYKVERGDQAYLSKNDHQISLLTSWREKLCSVRKCETFTEFYMTHASSPYILQIVASSDLVLNSTK